MWLSKTKQWIFREKTLFFYGAFVYVSWTFRCERRISNFKRTTKPHPPATWAGNYGVCLCLPGKCHKHRLNLCRFSPRILFFAHHRRSRNCLTKKKALCLTSFSWRMNGHSTVSFSRHTNDGSILLFVPLNSKA